MKYKCIKTCYYYDVTIADIGHILDISNGYVYNLNTSTKFSKESIPFDVLMNCVEAITDEASKVSYCSVASTPKTDVDRFIDITKNMIDIFIKKNHDYGNSFEKSLDKRGLVAALVRMEDKFNRLDSLSTKEAKVNNESIADTLIDLANYCIMAKIWLDKQ